eukprot:c30816_g1_i1 orf=3-161(-)
MVQNSRKVDGFSRSRTIHSQLLHQVPSSKPNKPIYFGGSRTKSPNSPGLEEGS